MVGAQLGGSQLLADQLHKPGWIGEEIVAEGDDRALGAGVHLLDIGLLAGRLDGDHLKQVVHLGRHLAEPVHQFGGQGVDLGGIRQRCDPAVQRQANRQILHIGVGDQHRRADGDLRRPFLDRQAAIAALGGGHRFLDQLLVQFDPHLADVARLFLAQQIARAANVQVVAGQLEAGAQGVQRLHDLQPLLRRLGQDLVGGQGEVGIAARLAAADAAAQLIELAQAEHIGAVDDQRIDAGHVDARFDDVGGQQHVVLLIAEGGHHLLQLGGRQPAMGDRAFHLGHQLGDAIGHPVDVGQPRADVEDLAAAIALAQDRLAHHHRVEGQDESTHRQTVHRRGGDDAHLLHACQRQLQRARDGRGGQGEDMDIRPELLEALLVGDTEMLFLVDDQQSQALEGDGLGQERMGAHDDVDGPVRHALLHLARMLGRHQAGQLLHVDGQPFETLGEIAVVLARQQRGGHHDGHLHAGHGGDEGRAHGHFGLAEAHIAAHQPVHGPARLQIGDGVLDGAALILGLGIGEAGAELVPQPFGRRQAVGLAHLALGGYGDQLVGHVADALLELRFPRLPRGPAQLVQLGPGILRAIAGEDVDVLDRHEKLVAAFVQHPQAVVRSAAHLERHQAVIAADAVFHMHHQIAFGQGGGLGDELGSLFLLAGRPGQTVAQHVLFGDHQQIRQGKAMIDA